MLKWLMGYLRTRLKIEKSKTEPKLSLRNTYGSMLQIACAPTDMATSANYLTLTSSSDLYINAGTVTNPIMTGTAPYLGSSSQPDFSHAHIGTLLLVASLQDCVWTISRDTRVFTCKTHNVQIPESSVVNLRGIGLSALKVYIETLHEKEG